MGNLKVKTVITIFEHPVAVFEAFADFPKSATIFNQAVKTEFLSPNTTGMDAEWIQYGPEPERVKAHHRIIAFQPHNTYTMTTDDPSALETMEFRFSPTPEGTVVAFDLEVRAKGLFVRLFAGLTKPLVKGMMDQDLARMKEYIESQREMNTPGTEE